MNLARVVVVLASRDVALANARMHRVDARLNPLGSGAFGVTGAVGMDEQQMKRSLKTLRTLGDAICASEFAGRKRRQPLHRAQVDGMAGVDQ